MSLYAFAMEAAEGLRVGRGPPFTLGVLGFVGFRGRLPILF